MFKFLKRAAAGANKGQEQRTREPRPEPARVRGWTQPSPLDRLPLPDVHESDDESAWDEWEHSQMELDSRMGPLSVYDTVRTKQPATSSLSDLDPFEAIRRKT